MRNVWPMYNLESAFDHFFPPSNVYLSHILADQRINISDSLACIVIYHNDWKLCRLLKKFWGVTEIQSIVIHYCFGRKTWYLAADLVYNRKHSVTFSARNLNKLFISSMWMQDSRLCHFLNDLCSCCLFIIQASAPHSRLRWKRSCEAMQLFYC